MQQPSEVIVLLDHLRLLRSSLQVEAQTVLVWIGLDPEVWLDKIRTDELRDAIENVDALLKTYN